MILPSPASEPCDQGLHLSMAGWRSQHETLLGRSCRVIVFACSGASGLRHRIHLILAGGLGELGFVLTAGPWPLECKLPLDDAFAY